LDNHLPVLRKQFQHNMQRFLTAIACESQLCCSFLYNARYPVHARHISTV